MSYSGKAKLRSRLRGEKRNEELLSTVDIARTHKASAAGILYPEDKRMPNITTVGQNFYYSAWWPQRKLVFKMAEWAGANKGCIPTRDIVADWVLFANLRYKEEELEVNERLNVARLPEKATKKTKKAVDAGTVHECLHKVYTSQDYIDVDEAYNLIIKRWAQVEDWSLYSQLLLECGNIVEDIKIERLGCVRFGGISSKMADLQDFILSMEADSRDEGAKLGVTMPALSVALSTFRDLGLGYQTQLQRDALKEYEKTNEEAYKMVTEGSLAPILKEAMVSPQNRAEIAEYRKDSWLSTRCAMDIIIAIEAAGMKPEPKSDKPDPDGKVKCQGCGAPSDRLRAHYHPTDDTKIIITCLDCGHQIEMDKPQQGGGTGPCPNGGVSIELPPEGQQPQQPQPPQQGGKPDDVIKWGGEDFEKPKGDAKSSGQDGDGDASDSDGADSDGQSGQDNDGNKENDFKAKDQRSGKYDNKGKGAKSKSKSKGTEGDSGSAQSNGGSQDGDQSTEQGTNDTDGDQNDQNGVGISQNDTDGDQDGSTSSTEGENQDNDGDEPNGYAQGNDENGQDGEQKGQQQGDKGDDSGKVGQSDTESFESPEGVGKDGQQTTNQAYQAGGQAGDADAQGNTIADIIKGELSDGASLKNSGMLDMNSAIQGQASKEEAKDLATLKFGEQKWCPLTTEDDEIRWAKGSKAASKQLLKSVRKECRYLLTRLRTVVQGMEDTIVDDGVPKGKRLSSRNLVNSFMDIQSYENPKRAFCDITEECAPSCAVSVIVDESGSMGGMIAEAGQCALAIAEPMSKLGAAVQVSGITSNHYNSTSVHNPSAHRNYGVVYNMVKDYDEPMNASIERFSGLRAQGGTPLADGIEFAYRGIRQREEQKKIIFVITDGQPDHGHSPVMKYQRRLCKEEGIILIGVGIGYGATYVSTCFDESIHAYDINELPKKLVKVLTDLITKKKGLRKTKRRA